MSTSFKTVHREIIGRDQWDAFVKSSDEAWLWHRFDFQDAIATWPGKNDISFAVIDESSAGKILAVVPLHLIKQRTIRIFSNNYLDSTGGPACDNDCGRKFKNKILEYINNQLIFLAKKHNASAICMALSLMAPAFRGENCPRVNPLLRLGCDNMLTQTWVINLHVGNDLLWQQMEGRARTEIRKSEKSGVEVRMGNQPDDMYIYYRLHCETYHRTGVHPHPREYFEAMWSNFFNKGFAYILFAHYKGEVIAAETFGIYKKAAIYWTGAANNKGLSFGSNSMLQWTAMQWMVEKKIEWYETGEAFPQIRSGKLKGLNDFKKSFGGVLYPYYKGKIDTRGKFQRILSLLRNLRH